MLRSRPQASMTRRSFLGAVGVTAAGALLVECTPSTPAVPGASATSTTAPVTSPSASQAVRYEGITLRISTQNGPSTDALKPLMAKFESKYGAKVEILEDVYTQIQTKQFAEAAAHTGAFDLIGLQTFDLGKYVTGGVLADLQPLFDDSGVADPEYDLADFAPAFVNGYCRYEFGGKQGLYALPHKFDIYLAIYRPDLFDAAGVAHPGDNFSYADLVTAAARLKSKQPDALALSMPLKSPGPAFTTWSAIFRSNGGEFFDGNMYPLFNKESATSAAEQLKSMLPYLPLDALSLDFDPAIQLMAQGRAAYAENWNSFFPTVLDPQKSTVKDKISFTMTPAGSARRAQELGGWTLGLSPDSKNKPAAFTLLQFLTSKANAAAFALAGGSSARTSVANDPQVVAAIPYYPLLIQALKNAKPRPTDPTWGQVQGAVGTAVNKALQPAGDPKVELTTAAQSVYTIMQRAGFHPEKTGPAPQ